MLAIARGLVGDNDLLLVDEPREGLAPLIVADVADALSTASEEVTMFWSNRTFRWRSTSPTGSTSSTRAASSTRRDCGGVG